MPASRPEFGDYQVNGVLRAAKKLHLDPRALAQQTIDTDTLGELASDTSVAGPGFVNITLSNEFLSIALAESPLLTKDPSPKRFVVDYSSPNIAKELHVGHLRSTVIGDSIVRMLQYLGHEVIRQNHVGDWGTGFGKLLAFLDTLGSQNQVEHSLRDLEQLYVAASKKFDEDPEFAALARECVVRLQNDDPAVCAIWEKFIDVSLNHMQDIYHKLDVLLTLDDVRGESAYKYELPHILETLRTTGLLVESDGAQCVFVEGFERKDGSPLPMIVQKSDGGYLYHTTDLATLQYRIRDLKADSVLYFTDARQILHFELMFAVAKKAGIATDSIQLEHHVFGSILGSDGGPFQTRSGESVLLANLIDEGISRARLVVGQKSGHLPIELQEKIAQQVAVGAIKYADLSKNRTNDYKFDWNTMLSLEGNTAPYLQYAYARVNAIFLKGQVAAEDIEREAIKIDQPAEHDLAVRLLRFQEMLELSVNERKSHHLCSYLYDLTAHFMRFYENCSVLTAPPKTKESRLALCARTAETLKTGLDCIGIATPARL